MANQTVDKLRSVWGYERRGPCPVHNGDGPNFFLFASGHGYCHSRCGFLPVETLGKVLDVEVNAPIGITVESFLAHFGLPEDFAHTYQLETRPTGKKKTPTVVIPYFDADGNKVFERYRHNFDKSQGQKFSWQRKAQPTKHPFGIQWWNATAAIGVLVAGETDQMALQATGVMSLGIPGDGMIDAEVIRPLVEEIGTLLLWSEGDESNERLISKIAAIREDARVLKHPTYKDPAEFVQNEGIVELATWLADAFGSAPYASDYLDGSSERRRQEILCDAGVIELLSRNGGDLYQSMREDVASSGFAGDASHVVAGVIAACSRGSNNPLKLYFRGQSSSGKTYAAEQAMRFVDPKFCVEVTASSPGAWVYRENNYQDKVLLIAEIDSLPQGDSTIASAVRAATGKGNLIYETTVDTPNGRQAVKYDKGGNFALLTTGIVSLEKQTETRMLSIDVPDGRKQIDLINRKLSRVAAGTENSVSVDWDTWHKMTELPTLLPRNVSVLVPFAERLWEEIPASYKTQSRANRDYPILIEAIKTVAKLRCARMQNLPQVIKATLEDYGLIREIFGSTFMSAAGSLSDTQQEIYDWLKHHPDQTTRQICGALEISQQTVNYNTRRLADKELIIDDGQKRNKRWSVIAEAPDDIMLPTEFELEQAIDQRAA